MAADAKVRVSLRRSTVEMIRDYDPKAPSLDDAIEEMLIEHPPRALVEELDRRERGRFVPLEKVRRKRRS